MKETDIKVAKFGGSHVVSPLKVKEKNKEEVKKERQQRGNNGKEGCYSWERIGRRAVHRWAAGPGSCMRHPQAPPPPPPGF